MGGQIIVERRLWVDADADATMIDGRKDSEKSDWGVRDDWYASVMWYDWEKEGGVREHIDKLMARR